MKQYLFYTGEGYTVSPNDSELESLQILGIEEGNDEEEALLNLIQTNDWIIESGFKMERISFKICL